MNARIFLTIFLAVALSGCSVFGVQNVSEPAYTVELEDGAIEIRRYTDILIAETKVKAGYEDMGKEGFRRLSGYIFGKNEREQEISMTAPVLQEGGGEEWSMSFVMPESVTEANAPIPNDEQVNLIKVPGKRVAVLKYRGSVTEEIISQKGNELLAWLDSQGYRPTSEIRSARYDPPWTIPALRRNEVHIDIK